MSYLERFEEKEKSERQRSIRERHFNVSHYKELSFYNPKYNAESVNSRGVYKNHSTYDSIVLMTLPFPVVDNLLVFSEWTL